MTQSKDQVKRIKETRWLQLQIKKADCNFEVRHEYLKFPNISRNFFGFQFNFDHYKPVILYTEGQSSDVTNR